MDRSMSVKPIIWKKLPKQARLLAEVLGHLLDLSQDGLLALTALLVLCIEGLEIVAKDFNLHLRLRRV
eukprot:s525_g7.t1